MRAATPAATLCAQAGASPATLYGVHLGDVEGRKGGVGMAGIEGAAGACTGEGMVPSKEDAAVRILAQIVQLPSYDLRGCLARADTDVRLQQAMQVRRSPLRHVGMRMADVYM